MIAMQMRDEDRIDAVRIQVQLSQGNEARCATIDQESAGLVLCEKAGVEAATSAKRIAAANEGNLHCCSLDRRGEAGKLA